MAPRVEEVLIRAYFMHIMEPSPVLTTSSTSYRRRKESYGAAYGGVGARVQAEQATGGGRNPMELYTVEWEPVHRQYKPQVEEGIQCGGAGGGRNPMQVDQRLPTVQWPLGGVSAIVIFRYAVVVTATCLPERYTLVNPTVLIYSRNDQERGYRS